MDQELFARFQKCAVEVLSVDEGQVTPDAKFGDDLDADSLDLVELVMALEEEFGVEVPREPVLKAWAYLERYYRNELQARESRGLSSIVYLRWMLSNYPDASWTGDAFSDEDLENSDVDPLMRRHPAYINASGIVENIDLFAAEFFNVSPREASLMDPQLRFFVD